MKIKTTWNLDLLYKNPKDPQIEKDIQTIKNACLSFSKKWLKNKKYLTNEKVLLQALSDYEALSNIVRPNKPLWYFQLLSDIENNNEYASAQAIKIDQQLMEAFNSTIFFTLSLGKIDNTFKKKILKNKNFKPYHYFLTKIFNTAKYQLSEPEEKILNKLDIVSYTMWTDGVQKQLGAQKILFKGKEIGLGEASNIMQSLPRSARLALHKQVKEKLAIVAPFAEAEINAVVTDKKISDELRGYKHQTSSTILKYENDEQSIHTLAKLVTEAFPISHRFYKIKQKMMKLSEKLRSVDINASVGSIKRSFDFPEAVEIAKTAFGKTDPLFEKILDSYLEKGQIDVFPRLNKRSGAYCWGHPHLPTFVLLNHVPSFNSVSTLAHEMGHAIHTEFSKKQSIFYERYSTSTAEVASTLFENFVFDEVMRTLSPKEQIIALHDHIADDMGTIFRQIAFFNFEIEMHEIVRAEGFIVNEKLCMLMNKHLKSYIGDQLHLDPDDGLFWVRLSHIRSYFYVYTYAFGQLVSKALYAEYKKDSNFIQKIKQFLYAGGSDTPENIFKSIGIDTTKPEFWKAGLESIENDIKKLEKMVTNFTKKK